MEKIREKFSQIEDKRNEIPVFQSMLDCLDIKEKIIIADAMHYQKDTCAKIIKIKAITFLD